MEYTHSYDRISAADRDGWWVVGEDTNGGEATWQANSIAYYIQHIIRQEHRERADSGPEREREWSMQKTLIYERSIETHA